jgi:hypothetical protein
MCRGGGDEECVVAGLGSCSCGHSDSHAAACRTRCWRASWHAPVNPFLPGVSSRNVDRCLNSCKLNSSPLLHMVPVGIKQVGIAVAPSYGSTPTASLCLGQRSTLSTDCIGA